MRVLWVAAILGFETLNVTAQPIPPTHVDDFSGKPRVVVISDIGNEPDDQMSFVRFLMYSNEFDIEAMIATTSTWQRTKTHPETMRDLIDSYGEVRPNLLLHAKGWPDAADLRGKVYTGQSAYGMAAAGAAKSSDGSKAIVAALEREDSRPLWVCIWGGANTLAQALMDLKAAHSQDDLTKLIAKLRVYSISDQDDAGPWIRKEFPDLFYIVSPLEPDERRVCVGDVDGDQRRSLLPERRRRGRDHGYERMARR